jgi:hypothetical protein
MVITAVGGEVDVLLETFDRRAAVDIPEIERVLYDACFGDHSIRIQKDVIAHVCARPARTRT